MRHCGESPGDGACDGFCELQGAAPSAGLAAVMVTTLYNTQRLLSQNVSTQHPRRAPCWPTMQAGTGPNVLSLTVSWS